MKSSKEKNRLFVFKWIILLELVDKHLARVYEKSWPPKKKEKKNIRKEERKKKEEKERKGG